PRLPARRPPSLALLALGLAGCCLAAAADLPLPDDKVAKLIQNLGHAEYAERQEANQELFKHPEAAPALKKAAESDNAEVARRARIVQAQLADPKDDTPDKLRALLKEKKADLALELLLSRPRWCEDGRGLDPFTMHFRDVLNDAMRQF